MGHAECTRRVWHVRSARVLRPNDCVPSTPISNDVRNIDCVRHRHTQDKAAATRSNVRARQECVRKQTRAVNDDRYSVGRRTASKVRTTKFVLWIFNCLSWFWLDGLTLHRPHRHLFNVTRFPRIPPGHRFDARTEWHHHRSAGNCLRRTKNCSARNVSVNMCILTRKPGMPKRRTGGRVEYSNDGPWHLTFNEINRNQFDLIEFEEHAFSHDSKSSIHSTHISFLFPFVKRHRVLNSFCHASRHRSVRESTHQLKWSVCRRTTSGSNQIKTKILFLLDFIYSTIARLH